MKKIVLELEVQDQDLDQLNSELQKTEQNFREVDVAANKTASSVDEVGKNGGAIATLDRLTGGAASQMRDLWESTKLFNLSLKGTRTALIATGIGAFVVALGVVVAYWDEIVDAVKQTNKRLENQLELIKSITGTLEKELDLVDKTIELNKLKGKGNEELQKQRVSILEKIKEQGEAEIKNLQTQLARLKSTSTELGFWEGINFQIQKALFGTKGLANAAADLAAQRLKEIKDLELAILDAQIKLTSTDIALFGGGAVGGAAGEGEEGTPQALTPAQIAALEQARTLEEAKTQILQEGTAHRLDIEKQASDGSIEIAQLEAQAKIEALNIYANALSGISNIIGQETAAGKAVAVAAAGVSTYLSAQQAYQSQLAIPTPDAPFRAAAAAAIAVAAGLANVKKILSVKIPGQGGGGSGFAGGSSFAGGNIPQPEFNVVGNTGINQIGQVIGEGLDRPTRSYVVYGDIEKAGQLEKEAIEGATI